MAEIGFVPGRLGYAGVVQTDAETERGAARRGRSPRDDPDLYDRFRDDWWSPRGRFAALHWLAHSRAELIPPPGRGEELLVDIGCGAGLLAPHVRGFRHLGIDLSESALRSARSHGVAAVKADAGRLPVAAGSASVVVAGEIFEHLEELDGCLDEIARVMRPGATLVFDTINDTLLARVLLIRLGERLPGGPPSELHDPALFVAPDELQRKLETRGIEVEWWGLRPSLTGYLGYLLGSETPVELVHTRLEAVLYQGVGRRR